MTDICGDLIGRLKAATGPDPDLDAEIWMTLNPDWRSFARTKVGGWFTKDGATRPASAYTDSIDAALTIVPMSLYWLIGCGKVTPGEPLYGAQVLRHDGSVVAEAESDATPAIAICIAALKARNEGASAADVSGATK